MFLDAFKNLILEPLIFQRKMITENIRVENNTEREIEFVKEKSALDKQIRKTTQELNAMIANIIKSF